MVAGLLEAIYEGGDAGTEEVVHRQSDVLGVEEDVADGGAGIPRIRQHRDLPLCGRGAFGVGEDGRFAGDVAEESNAAFITANH